VSAGTQKAFPVGASRERLGPEPPGTSNKVTTAASRERTGSMSRMSRGYPPSRRPGLCP